MRINCQYLEFRVVSGLGCVGAKLNGILDVNIVVSEMERIKNDPNLQHLMQNG